MIPLADENPTLRTPVMTFFLLFLLFATWIVGQSGGFEAVRLATSVCDYGMVPGELTGLAALGTAIPLGPGLACIVDDLPINRLTPLTSMFLHGGWGHLLGNALFFWVFGNNVEDSMGRLRFLVFYVICGLIAAGAHVALNPASAVPTVGASGAISGILGAYLVLYPRVRVKMLFFFLIFFRVIPIQAWLVLLFWFGWQVLSGLPQLSQLNRDISGGDAVWAHVGGFVAGVLLVKLFENRRLVDIRTTERHRLHPGHP